MFQKIMVMADGTRLGFPGRTVHLQPEKRAIPRHEGIQTTDSLTHTLQEYFGGTHYLKNQCQSTASIYLCRRMDR